MRHPRGRVALRFLVLSLALSLGLATPASALERAGLLDLARHRAAQELGVSLAAIEVISFHESGARVGDRAFAVGKFGAAGRGALVAVDLATGETLDSAEYAQLIEEARGRPDKFTPTARVSLDSGRAALFGFILKAPDYSPVVAQVKAAHPEVEWRERFPVSDDLTKLRAVRHALMVAKSEANKAAAAGFLAEAARLGAIDATSLDLAPMIYVQASPTLIEALADRSDVVEVRATGPYKESMISSYSTIRADWAHARGWKGSGIRIGIIEYGEVDWTRTSTSGIAKQVLYVGGTYPSLTCNSGNPPNVGISTHYTRAVSIAASRNEGGSALGIAPSATVVASSANTADDDSQDADRRIVKAVECAILNGDADLISTSLVQNFDQTLGEAYFDHLVYEHGIMSVSAAGNNVDDDDQCPDEIVRSPGSGWNVLTVGGMRDNGDGLWGNDTLWYRADGSEPSYCWREPPKEAGDAANDRIKPELVAPAHNVDAAGYGVMAGSGTSFATPMVSGTAAVMMGLDTSLVAKPEAVRAGIIAAARTHRTPTPQGGISNSEEGTGTLNTKWSALVVNGIDPTDGTGSHGDLNVFTIAAVFDVLTGCFVDPGDRTVNFSGVAGRTMRFVMVWNSHTSSHPGHTSTTDTRYGDLDLKIFSPGGGLQGQSTREASNVEYVDFTAPTSGTYQARVEVLSWDCANPAEEIGWAYVSY